VEVEFDYQEDVVALREVSFVLAVAVAIFVGAGATSETPQVLPWDRL
jgi:hypothetical protein